MTEHLSWQYDEFRQVGMDYCDPVQVEAYDSRHSEFRDVDAECKSILDSLGLPRNAILIELGTGTGTFAIHAAHHCASVYAVDISKQMLDFAASKAEKAGVKNITFYHAGFLTYNHQDESADAIVTSMALHHLPDFWKSMALNRINGMLKQGGKLFINDVVFQQTGATVNISRWIDHMISIGGIQLGQETATHVREEYSTFDWIMDGIMERSGFKVLSKEVHEGVIARYLCIKETEIA